MIPFTRIMTVVMFGAICFILIVPMALQRHNTVLATGVSVAFVAYLILNIFLWRRLQPKK
jgi:amino acid transporter